MQQTKRLKRPSRSPQDDACIKNLQSSINTPDVSEEDVYTTAMRPSKRGVAPGPNGDRAEFLQSAFYNPFGSTSAATVVQYMTKHINLERQGRLSDEWYEVVSSVNLIAITRKLRPIGMGYSGRKLVSGVSSVAAAKDIREKIAPFQLSSLIRNGSDSVVHLVRQLHELYGDSHVFLQIDVKNAFNSVSRLHGLLAIAQHLPQLYTCILRTYRNMNKMWINATDDQIREYILRQEGSTQGAVDGGIFFNNAINDVLHELNKLVLQLGGGTFVAIADDIIGCIKPEAGLPAFQLIEDRFSVLNLQINYEKSTLFLNNQHTLDMQSQSLSEVRVIISITSF